MEILKTVLLILFAIDCIALTVIVLMQEGVLKGEKLGRIAYYLDGKLIDFYPVYAEKSVEKISFKWYTEKGIS